MTRGEGQPRASSCLTVSLRLSHLSYLPLEHTLLHPKFPTALLAAEVGPTSPPPPASWGPVAYSLYCGPMRKQRLPLRGWLALTCGSRSGRNIARPAHLHTPPPSPSLGEQHV